MVKVVIKVDDSQFQSIHDKLPEIKDRGLKYVGQEMLRNLQLNSPVDEGLLKKWFFYDTSAERIEIRTPAEYAIYVNDGTGIYAGKGRIKPKSAKALVFKPGPKWRGPVQTSGKFKGLAAFKSIKGQKGQKFVEKSMKQTQSKLEQLFIKAVSEVI